MEAGTFIIWIFAALFVVAGIAGLILPVLPGPILLLAGLFLAAWAEHFAFVGPVILLILTVLALSAHALDFLAGAMGVKRFGASREATIGAAIGSVFGMFFGFFGIVAGPFIGAVIGEVLSVKNIQTAGHAGIGAWVGMMIGIAAKVAIGFTMIGIFLIARLF